MFVYNAALDKRLFPMICHCTSSHQLQHAQSGLLLGTSFCYFIALALRFTYRNTKRTHSLQAVAAVREEDLMLLGVLPGHARRMLLRLPSLRAAAIPVDGGAAAAAANNPA